MKINNIYLIFIVIVLIILYASPASSCGVSRTYYALHNFELIEEAEAIVVATPYRKGIFFGKKGGVKFRLDQIIKGDVQTVFTVGRVTEAYSRIHIDSTKASDPEEIIKPHPESFRGACNRNTVTKNKQYVLFIYKDRYGSFQLLDWPFTRVNEDYYGDDSPWMRAIQFYLRIGEISDPIQQLEQMTIEHDNIINNPDQTKNKQLAKDIAIYLKSYSPLLPTQYLLATFDELNTQSTDNTEVDTKNFTTINFENSPLKPWLLRYPSTPSEDNQDSKEVEQIKLKLLWILALGEHPDANPLFEYLASKSTLTPVQYGAIIQYFIHQRNYPAVMQLAEIHTSDIINDASKGQIYDYLYSMALYRSSNGLWLKSGWRSDNPEIERWRRQHLTEVKKLIISRFGELGRFEWLLRH